jgi:hypothetical protein
MSDAVRQGRLITIPVSHYCEKTCWALTRLQVSFGVWGKFSAIAQLPDRMGDRIQALRGTAAGQFVLKLYDGYNAHR